MSSSNAVGFQFQGDVFAGGNLTWQAAGRLFKALSDGGIDPYSLSALVQLGKVVKVSESVRLSIEHLVRTRNSRTTLISKALWLGWGHNEIAGELAKTQAGVSAMALIAAFSAGSSEFETSRALIEFMRAYGCEDDMLPSIDALRPTVAYLSPIVRDCGMTEVFSQIKRQCEAGLDYYKCWEGANAGDAHSWVVKLKLLLSAYSEGVNITLCTAQRAFWFAAFATRILHMEVRLLATPRDKILWQCAGRGPTFTIYLQNVSLKEDALVLEAPLTYEERAPMHTFCKGKDYFPCLINTLDKAQYIDTIIHRVTMDSRSSPFPETSKVTEICSIWIGHICQKILNATHVDDTNLWLGSIIRTQQLLNFVVGLSISESAFCIGFEAKDIDDELLEQFDEYTEYRETVSQLASFMAAAVLALCLCKVEVCEMLFYEQWQNIPSRGLPLQSMCFSQMLPDSSSSGKVTLSMVLKQLTVLFAGPQSTLVDEIVAFSTYDFAIYPSVLMENVSTDFMSMPFTISKGRLSYKGSLRTYISEAPVKPNWRQRKTPLVGWPAEMVGWPKGSCLYPQYHPGPNVIHVYSSLQIDCISIQVVIYRRLLADRSHESGESAFRLLHACQKAFSIPRCGTCNHRKDREYDPSGIFAEAALSSFGYFEVPNSAALSAEGSLNVIAQPCDDPFIFVGLSGAPPLEQLIQATELARLDPYEKSRETKRFDPVLFQGDSCLECASRLAQRMGKSVIIMQ